MSGNIEVHQSSETPSNTEPPNPDFGEVAIKNVFELWFTPELERRRAAGLIGDNFVLWIAQAIFPEEGENKIRLNEEVRGVMWVKAQRSIEKGEQVLLDDLADIRSFELEDDELNHGHFTVIRRGPENGWMLAFNALAGRAKAGNFVRLASEFFETSIQAKNSARSGPCLDNLFSCCELLAKAELIMQRSQAVKSKKHGAISSAINAQGKLGNVHPVFVDLLNRLSNKRSAARYEGTTNAQDIPSEDEFQVVSAYIDILRKMSSAQSVDPVTPLDLA